METEVETAAPSARFDVARIRADFPILARTVHGQPLVYIDNAATYHQVVRDNSIGVEFAGNYPDVTRGATDAQVAAWRVLVRVLKARYGIPADHVYAHNWIDFKDARYCEGCVLATMARQWDD